MIQLHHGDCLDILKTLPDNSVDAVVTDPPYHQVKDEAWDRQWESDGAFIEWVGALAEQWQRVLKPNGSLYCFASPRMAARVEVEIGKRFNVLNCIAWAKRDKAGNGIANRSHIPGFRAYFPQSERIIFAEHFGADNIAKGEAGYNAKCDELRGFVFEPLRSYLDGERRRAGIDKADCNVACGFSRSAGGMASRHYFSRSQWQLPTREHYESLRRLFNANGGDYLRREYDYLRREYDYLRREYDYLRREYDYLRRPFAVTPDVPYTDVWEFPTVQSYPGKHPCEKPLAMMEHIIRSSTRPGAVVFDGFLGSGTTAVAAQRLGRSFIGCDFDQHWVDYTRRRLDDLEPPLFAITTESP